MCLHILEFMFHNNLFQLETYVEVMFYVQNLKSIFQRIFPFSFVEK